MADAELPGRYAGLPAWIAVVGVSFTSCCPQAV